MFMIVLDAFKSSFGSFLCGTLDLNIFLDDIDDGRVKIVWPVLWREVDEFGAKNVTPDGRVVLESVTSAVLVNGLVREVFGRVVQLRRLVDFHAAGDRLKWSRARFPPPVTAHWIPTAVNDNVNVLVGVAQTFFQRIEKIS